MIHLRWPTTQNRSSISYPKLEFYEQVFHPWNLFHADYKKFDWKISQNIEPSEIRRYSNLQVSISNTLF